MELLKLDTNENPSLYGKNRKLIEHPNPIQTSGHKLYGVAKKKGTVRLPLLVTGSGRSGTTWLAKTLQSADVDCPHEYCGEHGTVSWYFFTDSNWHPYHPRARPAGRIVHIGERRSDFEFDKVVHLVRDPLKTIGSICPSMFMTDHWYVAANADRLYPEEIIDRRSRLLKAMYMAHALWKTAEASCDIRIRLEDVPKHWKKLMRVVGQDPKLPMPKLPPKNKSHGIYLARKVTYSDLWREDELLAKNISKLAAKFGY